MDILHSAMDLNDDGKYKRALPLFTKAVRALPEQPQAYFERAMCYLNLEQDAKAETDLLKALALDPDFPGAAAWLAVAQGGQGKTLLAAQSAERSLRSGRQVSPQSWADCARLFMEAGKLEQARALLSEYFAE